MSLSLFMTMLKLIVINTSLNMIKKTIYISIVLLLICVLFVVDKKIFNIKPTIRKFILTFNDFRDQHFIQIDEGQYNQDTKLMKSIVLKGIPDLNKKTTTDISQVNMIRDWVNENSIWGGKTSKINVHDLMGNKTALQMWHFINATSSELDCGIYSVFLSKIYQLFGYESYVYDIGLESEGGHSVVLVYINDNNKRKLIVEDPTYNSSFTNLKGEPIDFFIFINKIKEKKESEIKIISNKGKGHKAICPRDNSCDLQGEKRWEDLSGKLLYRRWFDSSILMQNLSMFLYCRTLRYPIISDNSILGAKLMNLIFIQTKMIGYVNFGR